MTKSEAEAWLQAIRRLGITPLPIGEPRNGICVPFDKGAHIVFGAGSGHAFTDDDQPIIGLIPSAIFGVNGV